jgi:hypothetical protein
MVGRAFLFSIYYCGNLFELNKMLVIFRYISFENREILKCVNYETWISYCVNVNGFRM